MLKEWLDFCAEAYVVPNYMQRLYIHILNEKGYVHEETDRGCGKTWLAFKLIRYMQTYTNNSVRYISFDEDTIKYIISTFMDEFNTSEIGPRIEILFATEQPTKELSPGDLVIYDGLSLTLFFQK